MSMTRPHWDTEEVLAFVHDVRPWRDLDDAERAEWCRRVKHVRDNVTDADGKAWTNARLATMFGLAEGGLRRRFTDIAAAQRANQGATGQPVPGPSYEANRARATMRNPKLTPKQKADIIAEADAETKQAILEQLTDEHLGRLPFGGEKPKVPGEDHRSLANDIRSLCASNLANLAVLEVKLAEASVEEIDEVAPSLATVAHRSSEVLGPFVPSAESVEEWLRDRSGT
jgi:hypothetical protein